MIRIVVTILALAVTMEARAQSVIPTPPAQEQKGVGATGTMYDGNNLARFPISPQPAPNPTSPATTSTGVTGVQGSHDESGSGAGGGEH